MTATWLAADIEREAATLAATFEDETEWPLDVFGLVEALGGTVEVMFESPEKPESLQVRSRDDFTVIIPWNTSHARDRFTIAHELGHLQLHYAEGPEPTSFYRHGSSRQETEANIFAAALLMPRKTFERAFSSVDGDLVQLAEMFEVSRTSAEVRAKVLGLAD